MIRDESAVNLLLMTAGFVIWSSAFILLYVALSVGCEFGWDAIPIGPVSLQRTVLLAVWLLHIALIALLLFLARRRFSGNATSDSLLAVFFRRAILTAAVVATTITVFNYAPILGLSSCL